MGAAYQPQWIVPEPRLPRRWYVLCINPQRELYVLKWLEFVYVYTPLEWKLDHHGKGQKRLTLKPLCPGYIFVRQPQDDQWRGINDADGVRGVLQVTGDMATVSDDAIELLRRAEIHINLHEVRRRNRRFSPFKLGDKVRLGEEAGAFEGYEGVIQRLDKNDKIVLGLVLPARLQTLLLPAQWLKAV